LTQKESAPTQKERMSGFGASVLTRGNRPSNKRNCDMLERESNREAGASSPDNRERAGSAVPKKKRPPLILTIFWTVLGITAATVLQVFIREALESKARFTIDKSLVKMVNEANKSLPMTVDSDTRLDAAQVLPGRTIQYVYTLVNYSKEEIDSQIFVDEMRPTMQNSIKTLSDMKTLRDSSVTFVYLYLDKDGKETAKLRFEKKDYTE